MARTRNPQESSRRFWDATIFLPFLLPPLCFYSLTLTSSCPFFPSFSIISCPRKLRAAHKHHQNRGISTQYPSATITFIRHISTVGGNNSTYAAVTANSSARLALVMKPAQSAKMVVKTWIRPSLCSGVSAKYKPYIDPTSRLAATRMVMSFAAVEMDFSSNRPMWSAPSRVGIFCDCQKLVGRFPSVVFCCFLVHLLLLVASTASVGLRSSPSLSVL